MQKTTFNSKNPIYCQGLNCFFGKKIVFLRIDSVLNKLFPKTYYYIFVKTRKLKHEENLLLIKFNVTDCDSLHCADLSALQVR
ncbi:hypothetical protein D3C87_262540 [compost metagenome]